MLTHTGEKGEKVGKHDKNSYSRKGKSTASRNKKAQKGNKTTGKKKTLNTTFESHPNLGRCKK